MKPRIFVQSLDKYVKFYVPKALKSGPWWIMGTNKKDIPECIGCADSLDDATKFCLGATLGKMIEFLFVK